MSESKQIVKNNRLEEDTSGVASLARWFRESETRQSGGVANLLSRPIVFFRCTRQGGVQNNSHALLFVLPSRSEKTDTCCAPADQQPTNLRAANMF